MKCAGNRFVCYDAPAVKKIPLAAYCPCLWVSFIYVNRADTTLLI